DSQFASLGLILISNIARISSLLDLPEPGRTASASETTSTVAHLEDLGKSVDRSSSFEFTTTNSEAAAAVTAVSGMLPTNRTLIVDHLSPTSLKFANDVPRTKSSRKRKRVRGKNPIDDLFSSLS
ncbi:hypothetical protein MMC14_008266, partial [Varicellaria rhodocarpa]|nr:hypothetical protein [Varicellaria rhodocarpa]